MAKFEFRLQSVLSIREKLENQKELEYARALKRLEEEKAQLRALETKLEQNVAALSGILKKRITPSEIEIYNGYTDTLKDRIAVQEKAVKAAEERAEQKRKELVKAMRDRKTIEKLRDQAYEEYIEDEKHDEQRQVDQTVSYRYSRD